MRTVTTLLTGLALAATAGAGDAPPLAGDAALPEAPSVYQGAIQSGGPPKDGIPSVDTPEFAGVAHGDDYLDDGDIVIGVHRNGEARAYPQKILVWHEIVNDTVGGEAVSISYCPLTGTALGFRRGDTELGVSGRLINSNLVMYDRASDTFWPQILGAGIQGPHTGKALEELRVFWTTWGDWKERHPDTRVLTTDTGHVRNYRRDPYGGYNPPSGYYREDTRMFPVLHEDHRYAPKRVVLGFRDGDRAVAVDRDALRERKVLSREVDGTPYLVIHDPGLDTGWVYRGEAAPDPDDIRFIPEGPRFPGSEALEPVNAFEAMWFAWAAFYPDTEVIDGSH
ncbi:DUF3179 domain-containing protein [Arhodomonas sp. SL1]|uniref:DUF3179 domain-containing protein n=1 Tax=Arhodomonas sp. SL1 TaxID=3425691 RepID=UPI003F8815F4